MSEASSNHDAAQRLDAALARLVDLSRRGARLGLERMEEALGFLGNPELRFPSVHVAGTNGKGSVSAMVESILRRHGVRTGLYTSPHLGRFNERIRINGEPIDDAEFARVIDRAMNDEMPPLSFFEALTAAGFLAFESAKVAAAVVEVGLGGRLDATNVLAKPLATAITSIGLDHTKYLGDDHAAIAREKAGISKQGVPLIVGPLGNDATRAVVEVGHARGADPVLWIDDGEPRGIPRNGKRVRLFAAGEHARLRVARSTELSLRPTLAGRHQLANAAVAATIAWEIRHSFPGLEEHIEDGIAEARWPGRLERLDVGGVTVLLDCAHNAEGIATLCAHLDGVDPSATTLVFGAIDEKPFGPMLDAVVRFASRRHYCRPLDPVAGRRAVEPEVLALAHAGTPHGRPREAIRAALADARPGELVVVTGSIFLVGAVRAELLGLGRDAAIPL